MKKVNEYRYHDMYTLLASKDVKQNDRWENTSQYYTMNVSGTVPWNYKWTNNDGQKNYKGITLQKDR